MVSSQKALKMKRVLPGGKIFLDRLDTNNHRESFRIFGEKWVIEENMSLNPLIFVHNEFGLAVSR